MNYMLERGFGTGTSTGSEIKGRLSPWLTISTLLLGWLIPDAAGG